MGIKLGHRKLLRAAIAQLSASIAAEATSSHVEVISEDSLDGKAFSLGESLRTKGHEDRDSPSSPSPRKSPSLQSIMLPSSPSPCQSILSSDSASLLGKHFSKAYKQAPSSPVSPDSPISSNSLVSRSPSPHMDHEGFKQTPMCKRPSTPLTKGLLKSNKSPAKSPSLGKEEAKSDKFSYVTSSILSDDPDQDTELRRGISSCSLVY